MSLFAGGQLTRRYVAIQGLRRCKRRRVRSPSGRTPPQNKNPLSNNRGVGSPPHPYWRWFCTIALTMAAISGADRWRHGRARQPANHLHGNPRRKISSSRVDPKSAGKSRLLCGRSNSTGLGGWRDRLQHTGHSHAVRSLTKFAITPISCVTFSCSALNPLFRFNHTSSI